MIDGEDFTNEDIEYNEKNHCFECGEEIPHGKKLCYFCFHLTRSSKEVK